MKCTCGAQGLKHLPGCEIFRMSSFISAKREPVKYRYDVLYWEFIHAMAEIGHLGAEKYGDFNYKQQGLIKEKSPINHMANHLHQYIEEKPYDHIELSDKKKYHLAAIAFNAMMEFYRCDINEEE